MSNKSEACLIQGKTGPWEVVIGLEVHAQVTSKAKLFSSAATDFGADPNKGKLTTKYYNDKSLNCP